MDAEDFFQQLFIEHIGSASIVPLMSSITLEAMKLFGGYDLHTAAAIALAGLIAGCVLNWVIGYILTLIRQRVTFLGKEEFARPAHFFQRYGFVLAAFFWMPLGSILLLIMGFFRVSLLKILPVTLVGGLYYLRDYFLL